MSSQPTVTTIEHEGFTISGSGTEKEIRASLQPDQPASEADAEGDISKAASELGKKGGEAAAKARAKAAKAKPIPEKKETKADGEEAAAPAVDPGKEAEGEEDAEAEPGKDKRGNPRHDPTARVAQATREAAEARREAAEARREAYEARQRIERLERERTQAQEPRSPSEARDGGAAGNLGPAAPAEDAEPQEGDFEQYSDYVKALSRHEFKQAAKEHQRQQYAHAQAAQYAQEVNGLVGGWNESLKKAAADTPEFQEAVNPVLKRLPLPSRLLPQGERPDGANWIADDLMSAPDLAPGRLLYLSEHPDELQRLATLRSPREVTRELARIDARLEAATAGDSSEPPPQSKANPPVRPVTGAPSVASGEQGPRPGESFDQWFARQGKHQKR